MQYKSHNEVTETCETLFNKNNRVIPAGQDLRGHYYAVMQMANRAVQNSETGFAISRSIAASRWQTNAHRAMKLPDSPDNQARVTEMDMHKPTRQQQLDSTAPWATLYLACTPA